MSPICCKVEHMVWNLKRTHLPHVMRSEEGLSFLRREVPAQVVSYEVILSVDIGYNWMEFIEDNQIQVFPEENGHEEVRGLLVGAGQAHSHVIHK